MSVITKSVDEADNEIFLKIRQTKYVENEEDCEKQMSAFLMITCTDEKDFYPALCWEDGLLMEMIIKMCMKI